MAEIRPFPKANFRELDEARPSKMHWKIMFISGMGFFKQTRMNANRITYGDALVRLNESEVYSAFQLFNSCVRYYRGATVAATHNREHPRHLQNADPAVAGGKVGKQVSGENRQLKVDGEAIFPAMPRGIKREIIVNLTQIKLQRDALLVTARRMDRVPARWLTLTQRQTLGCQRNVYTGARIHMLDKASLFQLSWRFSTVLLLPGQRNTATAPAEQRWG